MLEARVECLQFPITGLEKIYDAWDNFTWQSKTTPEYSERQTIELSHKTRSFNIEEMYSELHTMTLDDAMNNDSTQK